MPVTMVYLIRKHVPDSALYPHEMEKVLIALGKNVVNSCIHRRLRLDVPDDIDGKAIGIDEPVGDVVGQPYGCSVHLDHIAFGQQGSGP